ncbi:hypothetical protein MD484_g844, partial [Candolleomyces efflorescens]
MPPISDFWPPVEPSLELLDEPTHKRITSLHHHLCESTITVPVEDVVTAGGSEKTMTLWERVETWALDVYHKSPSRRVKGASGSSGVQCRMVRDQWTWGQSFLVYEIVFYRDRGSEEDVGEEEEDSILESWVIRFGLPPYEGDEFFNTPDQLERKILNEVGALKVVKQRCSPDLVPVPDVWGFCARHGREFQQIFGGIVEDEVDENGKKRNPHPLGPSFPAFILMSAMKGKTIEECGFPVHELGIHFDELEAPPPSFEEEGGYLSSPILRTYFKSLAKIHYALSQVTFDKIGSFTVDEETGEVGIGPMAEFGLGPFDKAEEYFGVMGEAFKRIADASAAAPEEDEDEESEDADAQNSNPLNLKDSEIAGLRRQYAASLFQKALGSHLSPLTNTGPFPLRHGDLHSENILVDEETGEIVGVIDWEGAGTVPWEVAGALNWEVQGEVVEWDGNVKPRRTGVHTAFNEALKEVEVEMKELHQRQESQHRRRQSQHRKEQSTEDDEDEVYSTPMSTLSPSSSYTSLVSSSEGGHSSALSGRTHSRSSSISHLTAITSPPTSPASSLFDINKNSSNMSMKGAATSILEQVTRFVDVNKTPTVQNSGNTTSKIKKISSFFSRSASEPQSTPPPPPTSFPVNNTNFHKHIRTDSLCPEIIESIRTSPPSSPPSTPSKIGLKSSSKANAKPPAPPPGSAGGSTLQNPLSLPTIPTLSLSVAALAITASTPQPPLRLNSAHLRQATAPPTAMRRSPSPSPSPSALSPPEMLSRSPSTGAYINSPSPRYHRYTGSMHKRRMSSHFREFPASSYTGGGTGGLSVPSSPVLFSSPQPGYARRMSPSGSPGSTSPLLFGGSGGGRTMGLPPLTRTPSPSNGHFTTTTTAPGSYGPPTPRHPHGYAHTYVHSHGHVRRPSSWYLGLSGVPLTPVTPTAASMGLGLSAGGLKRSMSTSGAETTGSQMGPVTMKTAPSTPVPAPALALPSLSASTSTSSGGEEYFSAASSISSTGSPIEVPSISRRPPAPLPLSLPPAIDQTFSAGGKVELDEKPLPSLPFPPPPLPSPTLQVARTKSQLFAKEPTPVKKSPPIPLSDLHASVGSYVAGYLSHWMYVFGCEWETVGKALFDVIDQEEAAKLGPGAGEESRAEEAFWRWAEEQRQQSGEC